jgi:hypothetical protein
MKQKLQAREVLETWSNLNLEEKYVIYTHTAPKKKEKKKTTSYSLNLIINISFNKLFYGLKTLQKLIQTNTT